MLKLNHVKYIIQLVRKIIITYCECLISSSITPKDLPAAWLIALKHAQSAIFQHNFTSLYLDVVITSTTM